VNEEMTSLSCNETVFYKTFVVMLYAILVDVFLSNKKLIFNKKLLSFFHICNLPKLVASPAQNTNKNLVKIAKKPRIQLTYNIC